MASIKIETGIKVYDIEDSSGEVRGQIRFNPTDIDFPKRAREFFDKLEEYKKSIDEIKTSGLEDSLEVVDAMDLQVKQALNELFQDDNLSDVVFAGQNCFNTCNGETFIERFLNAILPILKSDIETESKKSDKRVSKYTKQVKK